MKQKVKKPRGYWKISENIINEINCLNEKGIPLNAKFIDSYNGSLRTAAKRIYGTWENAIKEAGLNYDEIKKTKERNKENVIAELLEIYNSGSPINQNSLISDNIALFSACVAQFGDYKTAVESCGLNYETIKKQESWNKEKVINILKNMQENNIPLNASHIQKENTHLYSAMYRLFGSFRKAIAASGLNYNEIMKVKHWTKDEIISSLLLRYKHGLPLNSTTLEKENESLYTACRNFFGSYEQAINSANINYLEVREDIKMINYFGYEFESLVGDVLSDLRITYRKKLNRKYQPDFIVKNNIWMDAKLSEWTVYKQDTIQKYEPMCKMLFIIYLRGDEEKDEMITQKTRMISVYKLIKQLHKDKRSVYLLRIKKLLDGIKEI
jgi:hypothetical protein